MNEVLERLGTTKVFKLAAIFLCLLFILLCFSYSLKLSLWGDEAYSLELAERSWQYIFNNIDVHLPTYYFFVKFLVDFGGISDEMTLRMIHATVFAAGLFLGYKTILFLSKSPKKSLLVLLTAVVSPAFIFYATNLRMYSLLFFFSMGYIFYLSKLLVKKEQFSKLEWVFYFIFASCLVVIDYPGTTLFLLGSSLVIVSFIKAKAWRLIFWSLFPLVFLGVYYSQLVPAIGSIFSWNTSSVLQISWLSSDIFELVSLIYSSFRPIFDLFVVSQRNIFMAFVIPSLFALGLLVSGVVFLVRQKSQVDLNILFVLTLAFYWVVAIPSGHSLPRVFLPALFFMPAFLILVRQGLPKTIIKFNQLLIGLLIITSVIQVINPTLHLYSIIPYKLIAKDISKIAKQEKVDQIVLSDNSLNNLSIERSLEEVGVKQLRITWVSPEKQQDLVETEEFLFISHIGENNRFVDYQKFPKEYQVIGKNNYVKLDELAYNAFWQKYVLDKASQDYAVSVYLIKNLSP